MELAELQRRCYELERSGTPKAHYACIRELREALAEQDAVYVAWDEDFNPEFPFAGLDCAVEMFTTPELGEVFRASLLKLGRGRVSISPVRQRTIQGFFNWLYYKGFKDIHLDSGSPVPLHLPACLMKRAVTENQVDGDNAFLRRLCICSLQFASRARKTAVTAAQRAKLLSESLKLKGVICGMLQEAVLYALVEADGEEDCLLHTPAAARLETERHGLIYLPKSKQPQLLYTGPQSLFCVERDGLEGPEKRICAFTETAEAQRLIQRFQDCGPQQILALTGEELLRQAPAIGGIVLDLCGHGLELSWEELALFIEGDQDGREDPEE